MAWAFAASALLDELLFCGGGESFGESGVAAPRLVQRAEPRQHGVGVWESGCVRCATVFDIVKGRRVTLGGVQCTGTRQHGMGVCDGGSVG